MENFNFINWVDVPKSIRGCGNKLNDFEIATYRNLTPKNKSSTGEYVTFSLFLSEIYASDKKIRIGYINNKVVFQFNKEQGLSVTHKKIGVKDKISSRVASKTFVDMILKSFNIKPENNSYRFKLVDLGNNTFLIDSVNS